MGAPPRREAPAPGRWGQVGCPGLGWGWWRAPPLLRCSARFFPSRPPTWGPGASRGAEPVGALGVRGWAALRGCCATPRAVGSLLCPLAVSPASWGDPIAGCGLVADPPFRAGGALAVSFGLRRLMPAPPVGGERPGAAGQGGTPRVGARRRAAAGTGRPGATFSGTGGGLGGTVGRQGPVPGAGSRCRRGRPPCLLVGIPGERSCSGTTTAGSAPLMAAER